MQSILQTLYHEKIYKTWKARIHREKESGIVDKSRNKLSICGGYEETCPQSQQ